MRFVVVLVAAVTMIVPTLIGLDSGVAVGDAATETSSGGTITVGASTGAKAGGTSTSTGTSEGGAGGGSSSFVPVCTTTALTLNDQVGPPAGVTTPGGWFSITCTTSSGGNTTENLWISDGTAAPAAPTVNPITVAEQAANSLKLPSPVISTNPQGSAVVNLPTWLWIDPSIWHPYSVSATVGSVTATATATPEAVSWTTGDGGLLTCSGPGAVYQPGLSASLQSTDCSHTYTESSAGQPSADGDPDQGAFPVRAVLTWQVNWTAQGAAGGGVLPAVSTTSQTSLRVVQVESVNS